ncbi:MAG TPA: peptidylprolyl isomerase [Burkholderiales bacterium]|nr:peptidylprolyl isomerase [Burkholderiales bacterium]
MKAAQLQRWIREPLLHFAIGGAVLFAVYSWLNPAEPGSGAASRQVSIGVGEVKWLATTWQRQWGREPTPEEMRELVSNLLKEELLSREAREMRLDENDTIVRRRLAQKLEFVLQDTARLSEPSEEELRRFYEASPAGFLTEARVSFSQVYFSREQRRDAAKDAVAALPKLTGASPADVAQMGDRLMVEAEFRDADRQAVAGAFGPEFARAVFELQPGAWHGPLESGYGLHLVRVAAAQPGRRRDFAEVRPMVLERWREQQLREAEARFFERLMAKYEVLIDDSVKAVVGELNLVRRI